MGLPKTGPERRSGTAAVSSQRPDTASIKCGCIRLQLSWEVHGYRQHCSQDHVVRASGKGKGFGSRGKGSWLKTESLEEQVLLASPLEAEKGPKVRRRSRYCKERSWSASSLWDRMLRSTSLGQGSAGSERAWDRNEQYLFGDSQQGLVQSFHQLLKSRPLRGSCVPALPH